MPLFIENRGVDCITATAELFDRYPHLQVCSQKVWLNLAPWQESLSSIFLLKVANRVITNWAVGAQDKMVLHTLHEADLAETCAVRSTQIVIGQ